MKVFCPEHKRGFFAPRQNPIKCENLGHVLGELNFNGADQPQTYLHWQYCCNCEHFSPISPEGDSLEQCPACARRSSLLHLCDRCFTMSFESAPTPVKTKNFSLSTDGLPQPACPGCLEVSSGEVREHSCDELGASFTTAVRSCPICQERLDIGPAFPMLVSDYLRKTKADNKLNVTFDYDSALFVKVEDGEFVIVPSGFENKLAVVLPRLTHFSNPREFYEIYQDYYHHRAELRVGEIFIHEPALVEARDEGWAVKSSGLLEIVDKKTKAKKRKIRFIAAEHRADRSAPATAVTSGDKRRPSDIESSAPQNAPAAASAADDSPAICQDCGSSVDGRYAFCWNCGHPMKPANPAADPPTLKASPRRMMIDINDVPTAQPGEGSLQSGMFSRERGEGKKLRRGNGSGLKLSILLVVASGAALLTPITGVAWFAL